MIPRNKYKDGAASFYIVAFSTLILMIVAISFATVIISEVERTSNDDLAQSAYDSALAGIEDAKLAYYNYQNCLMQKEVIGTLPSADRAAVCGDVIGYLDGASNTKDVDECDTVWNILGRGDLEGKVVETTSENINNNMEQATTCVAMTNKTEDYESNLSSSNAVDVIKLSFDEDVDIDKITSVRLSWFSRKNAANAVGKSSIINYENGFPVSAALSKPPVISFTLLQTGPSFTMDSFNEVVYGSDPQTNRGTVYLVPTSVGDSGVDFKNALVKSNDKTAQNDPINVGCANLINNTQGEYACSVVMSLPKPIGGARNENTFEVVMNLPYGQPETAFKLQFYCGGDAKCGEMITDEDNGEKVSIATLKDVQIKVDSTGRANDLFRRVEARLKNTSDLALTVMGPLELLDADDGSGRAGMTKTWPVICEYNFGGPTC